MELKPHGGKREGAGRKPLPAHERLQPVTIWLPPDLLEFCRTYGKEEGGTSALIRRLLQREADWRSEGR